MILVLLVILFILYFFQIKRIETEVSFRQEPYTIVETTTHEVSDKERQCGYRNYSYEFNWEGWEPEEGDMITPRYRLYNREEKQGTFQVYFAFFDNSEYSFDDFEGQVYDSVKRRLPWDRAKMYSEKVNVTLGPGEDALLYMLTKKADPDAVYWAYANVRTPAIYDCENAIVSENITLNRTLIKYRNITQTEHVERDIRIYELIIDFLMRHRY